MALYAAKESGRDQVRVAPTRRRTTALRTCHWDHMDERDPDTPPQALWRAPDQAVVPAAGSRITNQFAPSRTSSAPNDWCHTRLASHPRCRHPSALRWPAPRRAAGTTPSPATPATHRLQPAVLLPAVARHRSRPLSPLQNSTSASWADGATSIHTCSNRLRVPSGATSGRATRVAPCHTVTQSPYPLGDFTCAHTSSRSTTSPPRPDGARQGPFEIVEFQVDVRPVPAEHALQFHRRVASPRPAAGSRTRRVHRVGRTA